MRVAIRYIVKDVLHASLAFLNDKSNEKLTNYSNDCLISTDRLLLKFKGVRV